MSSKENCIKQLEYLKDIYDSQIKRYEDYEETSNKEYYSLLGGKRAIEVAIENIEVLVKDN